MHEEMDDQTSKRRGLNMEVTRVIIKKYVPMADQLTAVSIISAFNLQELKELTNKQDKTFEDAAKIAQYIVDFDRASQLMGFKNCQDLIDFAKIYGIEAIM